MKMVIISLVILLTLLGIWGYFHFTFVDPTTSFYSENLSALSGKIASDDWDDAEKEFTSYFEKWEGIRKIWIYFITQDDIDNIDSSMQRVFVYIKNRDKTMAQAELEHMIVLFRIIKENECLATDNIF
jgi:hypothetical protein